MQKEILCCTCTITVMNFANRAIKTVDLLLAICVYFVRVVQKCDFVRLLFLGRIISMEGIKGMGSSTPVCFLNILIFLCGLFIFVRDWSDFELLIPQSSGSL